MNKFLTRTSSLLILGLCGTAAYASSPWSEESASPIAQQAAQPAAQSTSGSGIPAPVSASAEEAQPAYMQEERETAPAATAETAPAQTLRSETHKSGDVLSMPASDQPARVPLLDFPRRGMSTQTVENELGRPNEIVPAVGTPPISRWVYDDRVVFFERASVVHVVAR